jgi:hypothetical protein
MKQQFKTPTPTPRASEMNGTPVVWPGPENKEDAFKAVKGVVDGCIKAGLFGSIDEVVKLNRCLEFLDPKKSL